MADLEQSVGNINLTTRLGFAYAFTIDYPATEGDLTGDVFSASILETDGTVTLLSVAVIFTTFTRLVVSLDAADSIQPGTNRWSMTRTTNGVPAPEFEGNWVIE
ncbi:MAG: hypothetical protein WCG80_16870 [Spirochaetales bacterium]